MFIIDRFWYGLTRDFSNTRPIITHCICYYWSGMTNFFSDRSRENNSIFLFTEYLNHKSYWEKWNCRFSYNFFLEFFIENNIFGKPLLKFLDVNFPWVSLRVAKNLEAIKIQNMTYKIWHINSSLEFNWTFHHSIKSI